MPARNLLLLLSLLPSLALAQFSSPTGSRAAGQSSPTATRAASPPPPTETRPVALPPPSRDRQAEESSQAADNARLRERLEKPALRQPPAATPKPKPRTAPATPAPATRPVYNSAGQAVTGMRQVTPNRVMDTRTGRYYDTVPSGDGQRIVPPPAATRGK